MSWGDDEDRFTAELRALAHPVRLRILSLLTGAAMTAADIARELGLTHANASYHLRHLLAVDAIQPVGEEKIRGGTAKRYRYIPGGGNERDAGPVAHAEVRSDAEPQPDSETTDGRSERTHRRLPSGAHLPMQIAVYAAVAGELRRRAAHKQPGGDHLTDAELWVTPEVWRDVNAQVYAASKALHEAAQPPRTPGTIRTNATIVMFEMKPDA